MVLGGQDPLCPWTLSVLGCSLSLDPHYPWTLSVPGVSECQLFWLLTLLVLSCSMCQDGGWSCRGSRCPEVAFCPGDLVYRFGSCLLTCDSLDQNHTCVGAVDGCVCPDGMLRLVSLPPTSSPDFWIFSFNVTTSPLLQDERCVLPEDCPCHHNGKLYHPNQTISKDCNTW